MKRLLKVLNPFVFCLNLFNYLAHLEMYRYCPKSYKPYDFSQDAKFF